MKLHNGVRWCVAVLTLATAQTSLIAQSTGLTINETVLGELSEGFVGPVTASADARHAAWVERHGSNMAVIVDGVSQGSYKFIFPDSLRFSPDGKIGYIASRTGRLLTMADVAIQTNRWHSLVVTEAILKQKGLTVRQKLPEQLGSDIVVVANGYEFDGYERTDVDSLIFSSSGGRFAYVAYKGGKYRMFLDGIEQNGDYDDVAPTKEGSSMAFSPDGKRFAYVGFKDKRWQLVIDGERGAWYDRVESVTFSPDSSHLAYVAKQGDKYLVVFDGKEGPLYSKVGTNLAFSHDSQHFGYLVLQTDESGKSSGLAVIDGVPTKRYSADGVGAISISSDGRRTAFIVQSLTKGRKHFPVRVVVDGQESTVYRAVMSNLVFSRDGSHLAFAASPERKKDPDNPFGDTTLVLDGQHQKAYYALAYPSVTFSDDGKVVAFVAASDGSAKFDSEGDLTEFRTKGMKLVLNGFESDQYDDFYNYKPLGDDTPLVKKVMVSFSGTTATAIASKGKKIIRIEASVSSTDAIPVKKK